MLSRLKFRYKIMLLPVIASAGFAVVLACAPILAGQNETNLERIRNGYVPNLEASRDLQELLGDIQRGLKDAADAEDASQLTRTDSLRDSFIARLGESSKYGVRDADDARSLQRELTAYYGLARRTTAAMISGQLSEDGLANIKRMADGYNKIHGRLQQGTKHDRAAMEAAFAAAKGANQLSMYIYLCVAAVCLLMMIMVSRRTIRVTMDQLSTVSRAFERMGKGDFTQPVKVTTRDELGELGERVNEMHATLGDLMKRVASSSDAVAAAAAGMFSSVREQEASATQQTASLEEMRRTIETLADASKEVARDAGQVNDLASSSLNSSQRIAEHTKLVSTHSERIGQILQLIQDIADKSDLLALNAALEGTKAGEIGRGFSLVAAEMRRLSEHVMDSVRDIRKLVADTREASHASVLATEDGIKLARETSASAMNISTAAAQQQEGTNQVNAAAAEIVSVVNEALSASAESTRSAETLLQLSQELKTAAEAFRFSDSGASRDVA